MTLETERLLLRPWRDDDREPYAAFNADAEVRRFYPATLSREETDGTVDGMIEALERDGFGFWAVERKSDGGFMGDVGFSPVGFPLRGEPPVQLGWLLGRPFWGQGYAPEAARACLEFAWQLGFAEAVAFTATSNLPSQRVMTKIGMQRDLEGDFEHPAVPEGHVLRPHVLYRIVRP